MGLKTTHTTTPPNQPEMFPVSLSQATQLLSPSDSQVRRTEFKRGSYRVKDWRAITPERQWVFLLPIMSHEETLAKLELAAAKAKALAIAYRNNKLWEGELSRGVSEIRQALEGIRG